MASKRLSHAIWLIFLALAGPAAAQAASAPASADRVPIAAEARSTGLRLAQAQPAPQSPGAAAPSDQQSAPEEPIGNVATLTGVATVTRNDRSIPLQVKDDIYLNDVVQTQASSSLSITFSDATTFRLSSNAQVTIDNYVYEEGGANNAGVFGIGKSTIAFVAAAVAKTGNMEITTPTASLGIRGTTGVVDVPEGAAANSASNVNIKLYPDADGRVGRIEVNDRQGGRLGALTSGASGFAIRPGAAGARAAAVPLTISPQQQQRDQGFVRQVHAAQTTGQRIVREQRDFRRANPGRVNPNAPLRQRGQTPGRPGQPGQPQPGQNRGGQQLQQPGNRQGQQAPGQQTPAQQRPAQPGQPPRAGQNASPTNPAQPGAAPRAGQNAQPANGPQGQPGAQRPVNAQPTNPAQGGASSPNQNLRTGTPPQPNAQPSTQPSTQQGAQPRPSASPPLPGGQRILQQRQPPSAPGAARPGLQNRPAARPARQAPPPKDKKKH